MTAAVTALQRALAAEQAAVYGYGVIGAHLTGAQLRAATGDWVAHQVARDQLEALLRGRGAEPDAAAVGYRLPALVRTAAEARSLAVLLEDRVTAALHDHRRDPETRVGRQGLRICAPGERQACRADWLYGTGADGHRPGLLNRRAYRLRSRSTASSSRSSGVVSESRKKPAPLGP